MNVLGIQPDIAWENKAVNFQKVHSLLGGSKVTAGTLVVLPEMFATGFSMKISAVIDDAECRTEKFLAETARQFGVYLVAGIATAGEKGQARNEAIVVDPQGRAVCRYCKLHPFSYAREHEHYICGQHIITFEWSGFVVAPFVCYDLRFPEIFRIAARRGANLFVVIANWPKARELHWRTLLSARAIENQAYVVGVNRCGRDPKITYGGGSLIIDPRGKILADAGSGETTIQATLDLDYLNSYRREFPALKDIRPNFMPL